MTRTIIFPPEFTEVPRAVCGLYFFCKYLGVAISSQDEDVVEERSSMASYVMDVEELSGDDVTPSFGHSIQYRQSDIS